MSEEHLIRWLESDKKISAIKTEIKRLEDEKAIVEREADDARLSIQQEMAETGEFEIVINGEYSDYKLYFPTAKESVKVIDVDAVPDEFCKIERKPKLKEIGEYIKSMDTPPNWASIELGTPKLSYKIMKKG